MNQRRLRPIGRLVLFVLVSLVLAACSAAGSTLPIGAPTVAMAPDGATQTSEGGEVTVTATWAGKAAGPTFTVALNTHSVDLDAIDLTTLATLSADGIQVRPTVWNAPKGGHHREGVLSFPTTADDGRPVIGSQTTTIELVIRGVAGVPERTFRWRVAS